MFYPTENSNNALVDLEKHPISDPRLNNAMSKERSLLETSEQRAKQQYLKMGPDIKSNPFKACVVPRPIAWISTIDAKGINNIAPFSYFNAVCQPPTIMFSAGNHRNGGDKDTVHNIKENGEFIVNIVTFELSDAMNKTSSCLPYGVSEAEYAKIATCPSHIVRPPRIRLSPINLECKCVNIIDMPKSWNRADAGTSSSIARDNVSSQVIFSHVVGIHISESIITNGRIDITKLNPLCRLGYDQYGVINELFSMPKIF